LIVRAQHPGHGALLGPYLYQSAFRSESEQEECRFALDYLRDTITFEVPHTMAAIVLETVVGANGILVSPESYLDGVRELCDEFGIMMICDEVMAGFGRCDEWFGVDRWDVTPDLITFAKGVNSGYIPLGGVILSDEIAVIFAIRSYPGGLTYSGHPLRLGRGIDQYLPRGRNR
jgi:taurine--2-oxoglutarate transaminase